MNYYDITAEKMSKIYIENIVNKNDFEIKRIESHDDIEKIYKIRTIIMTPFIGKDMASDTEYINSVTNWGKSYKLVVNKNIVGYYLLGDRQLDDIVDSEEPELLEDITIYKNKKGVEGVSFGILPDFRTKGYGNAMKKQILIDFSDYDYIFGIHYKNLNNIEHWLKHRKLIADSPHVYITLQEFPKSTVA